MTPRRLRIYANRTNIVDFSEAEEITPQLNISLLEGETAVHEYQLRAASFANVHSGSLFFVSLCRRIVMHVTTANMETLRATLLAEMPCACTTLASEETVDRNGKRVPRSSRSLRPTLRTHA